MKKFSIGQLADTPVERVYADSDMPEDLRAGPGVTLVTMFGNSSRFNGVDPRCTLVGDANPAAGQFRIQQSCMQQGGQSIVQQMNSLIAKGVVITWIQPSIAPTIEHLSLRPALRLSPKARGR